MIACEGYMAAHPQDLDHMVKDSIDKPISLESYQRQLGATIDYLRQGVADQLARIAAPTLVIHGDADELIPYQHGKYLAMIFSVHPHLEQYHGHFKEFAVSVSFGGDCPLFDGRQPGIQSQFDKN